MVWHAQRPQGDRRRRRDVERVHSPGHRDAHGEVDRGDRAPRQAVPLGAEHEREPLGRVGGKLVEADGVVGQRQGRDGEAQRRAARSTPPGQGSMRVHGTWNTVPIETRIARRYSGSAHRGVTSTASTPSAAALRKTAPTLVWSTMSSRTSDPAGTGEHVGERRAAPAAASPPAPRGAGGSR